MVVEEAITKLLKENPAVNNRINGRVYPMMLPQNSDLPAITYQLISQPRTGSNDGDSELARSRIEIRMFAFDDLVAAQLADEVRRALVGFSGKPDPAQEFEIDCLTQDDGNGSQGYADDEMRDETVYVRLSDFFVWHYAP